MSVLAVGCFSFENGRKECAGNFRFFFFPDSYRSEKIIQTDLSYNSFHFQAVSEFPVNKEFSFERIPSGPQFETLFLAKAGFVGKNSLKLSIGAVQHSGKSEG